MNREVCGVSFLGVRWLLKDLDLVGVPLLQKIAEPKMSREASPAGNLKLNDRIQVTIATHMSCQAFFLILSAAAGLPGTATAGLFPG